MFIIKFRIFRHLRLLSLPSAPARRVSLGGGPQMALQNLLALLIVLALPGAVRAESDGTAAAAEATTAIAEADSAAAQEANSKVWEDLMAADFKAAASQAYVAANKNSISASSSFASAFAFLADTLSEMTQEYSPEVLTGGASTLPGEIGAGVTTLPGGIGADATTLPGEIGAVGVTTLPAGASGAAEAIAPDEVASATKESAIEAKAAANSDVKAALGEAKVGMGYLADATKTVGVEIMTAYNEAGDWKSGLQAAAGQLQGLTMGIGSYGLDAMLSGEVKSSSEVAASAKAASTGTEKAQVAIDQTTVASMASLEAVGATSVATFAGGASSMTSAINAWRMDAARLASEALAVASPTARPPSTAIAVAAFGLLTALALGGLHAAGRIGLGQAHATGTSSNLV